MNRRGFLKGVFGAAALAAAALATKPVAALETITRGRDSEGWRPLSDWDRLGPAKVVPVDGLLREDPMFFDTDFGTIAVTEKQVRELNPGYFNDNGHPEVWIDLDSFYHAADDLSGKATDMTWRDHQRRMRARGDKFRNLTPAPEGALMHDYKTEALMEVQ